jgi:hypothetical protein
MPSESDASSWRQDPHPRRWRRDRLLGYLVQIAEQVLGELVANLLVTH